jgi:ubiquinone/menaquinone biosynthesis C-methylase UbiE
MTNAHRDAQKRAFDAHYQRERDYWASTDPLTRYLIGWRLVTSIRRLRDAAGSRFPLDAKILFLCAGDGGEASLCCDEIGLTNIVFSDLSSVAVRSGMKRDPRLKGIVLDAENIELPDGSYDIVVIQDGLHHLRSPTKGFTEMLRVADVGVVFIEPHDSMVGRILGTKWEVNGDAINFCFRWNKRLVEQIASSYLGRETYRNLSFSYWHHNIAMARMGKIVGGGLWAKDFVAFAKATLDRLAPISGNMFSGIVLKG